MNAHSSAAPTLRTEPSAPAGFSNTAKTSYKGRFTKRLPPEITATRLLNVVYALRSRRPTRHKPGQTLPFRAPFRTNPAPNNAPAAQKPATSGFAPSASVPQQPARRAVPVPFLDRWLDSRP